MGSVPVFHVTTTKNTTAYQTFDQPVCLCTAYVTSVNGKQPIVNLKHKHSCTNTKRTKPYTITSGFSGDFMLTALACADLLLSSPDSIFVNEVLYTRSNSAYGIPIDMLSYDIKIDGRSVNVREGDIIQMFNDLMSDYPKNLDDGQGYRGFNGFPDIFKGPSLASMKFIASALAAEAERNFDPIQRNFTARKEILDRMKAVCSMVWEAEAA